MKRHLLTPTLAGQTEESMQAIMDLRLDIIKEGNLAFKHANKSIDHVCAAGKMLIDLKERVGHGNFRKELIAIDMGKSTAANYMAVFRFVQRGGHLRGRGFRDALRIISKGDPAPVELNTDTPAPEYQLAPPAPKPKTAPLIIVAEFVDDVPAPAPAPAPAPVPAPVPAPDTNDDDVTQIRKPEPTNDEVWTQALEVIPKLTKEQRQELYEILARKWDCIAPISQPSTGGTANQ